MTISFWCISNPAQGRYVGRMLWAAGLCIALSAAAAIGIRHGHVAGMPAYLLAVLPAAPIVLALLATGAYLMEEKDEFQRNLYVQALLGGIALTLSLTTVWGNLEDFVLVPHLDLIWVYPMFWIFVVLAFPVVRLRYR
ncbi:MAG: hypothetical protein WA476_21480 [Acidobacteriaceae bacterium]